MDIYASITIDQRRKQHSLGSNPLIVPMQWLDVLFVHINRHQLQLFQLPEKNREFTRVIFFRIGYIKYRLIAQTS
jgi:hypothetical protein